ncbi:transcriptional regulator, GntR family [Faunimonas pinastri]|uniref:Transcriptional regulator, GntR family n=1 Tax=Faunimonas pinastri TaxID=1855383 RepID=A0A1H9PGL1_9HYPH|nr:FCD domain-containing protein [Faunimonas pinastri]SER47298.1 transcriptional regulator, GntR family [Faunimonas pinastri]
MSRKAENDPDESAVPPSVAGATVLPRGLIQMTVNAMGLAIVSGRWPPGSALPFEAELASEFGIGRNALREAVKVLAGKGLVRTARRYGSRVCDRSEWNLFDPDVLTWHLTDSRSYARFLRELSDLRALIEPGAAALAATQASAGEKARIVALAQSLLTASPEESVAIDVELHLSILDATHNSLIAGFRHPLRILLDALFQTSLDSVSGEHRYDPNPAIHIALATAIQGGRAEEARYISTAITARGQHGANALDRDASFWVNRTTTAADGAAEGGAIAGTSTRTTEETR